ncbi:SDR family NAD(P)-dependent oxidoreductase [Arthrobacter zhaoguopingii]|uniref:SDR family NAD(P)-dependent oxidoreductase n=1 Tax=Arthrobacter zhaoguopingii TaxID=2681491 RepID=UPI00135A8F4A|nr:SDR family oxidoreductase [Arthrobacter zhaoguopingii]
MTDAVSPAGAPAPAGLTVVVAGATSASGVAVARELTARGARVIAVGSHAGRLQDALGHLNGVEQRVCDLTDAAAVNTLAAAVEADTGGADGLIHLVGGWRGAKGITTQSDEDYAFLHGSVFRTLFNTSRAFYDQLARSPRGRLAAVSATAVDSPTAGSASYAAVKASAETWLRAVAEGFTRDGSAAASTALVVKALLDDAMREAQPGRRFPGYTHVDDLARAAAALFAVPAAEVNGQRTPPADLLAKADG